ncbi:hypothetical protein QQY66_06350 [Streptomyces sp. DG2A-72]|uniref:hypothetical protein n=1 Tax=Streptomyces sp. DG2A-72 TaxID=3051386 RepID=UPI00265C6246|nr:hypothetical protein [Streptomyces sp. DG2A-72]MDO0931320.1 hypothetical protein [Streptomyces sp. DG2A-72]
MSNTDDRRRSPSNTELKQQELRELLRVGPDLPELADSNARALLRNVILNRGIPESQHLIDAITRAINIHLAEAEEH